MFRATHLLLCFGILAVLSVSACGIKPSDVELPDDQETQQYPRVYPDPHQNRP